MAFKKEGLWYPCQLNGSQGCSVFWLEANFLPDKTITRHPSTQHSAFTSSLSRTNFKYLYTPTTLYSRFPSRTGCRLKHKVLFPLKSLRKYSIFPLDVVVIWSWGFLHVFESSWVALEKEAGCISAFSIRDPQFDFTPHTVLLNTPTGQSTGAKKHSCILRHTHTSIHSAHTYVHCYNSQTPFQLLLAADSVTVESIRSAEAVGELRRAEELINNAAERGRWLGMEERSICPRGLEVRSGPAGRMIDWCPRGSGPLTPSSPEEAQ